MMSIAAVFTSFLGVCIFASSKSPDNRHVYVSLQRNDHFFFGKDLFLGEKQTTDALRCLQYCLSVDRCWSVNLGPTDLGFSSSVCQLFAWNGRVDRHSLGKRKGFIYIKLHTPCDQSPCQNGGICVPSKTENNFRCECPKDYGGSVCEKSCVIFDFEDGNLQGWVKTGNAFNAQPTYGDNPTLRGSVSPANQSGDWWIGTFEFRPGPSSPIGYQGNNPTGTLTSPQFTIKGSRLSFLIGGGCAMNSTRAELLVNNKVVAKATGHCEETIQKQHWDVRAYEGKTAALRLIDSPSDKWGNINFDHLVNESC